MKPKVMSDSMKRSPLAAIYKGVRLIQWVLILMLILAVFQIQVTSSYSNLFIIIIIWLSYGLVTFMLIYLAWKFYVWFADNRNFFILAYLIAVVVLVSNVIITITYTTQIILDQNEIVMKSIGHRNASSPEPIATIFFISIIITFATMWVAAAILLKNFTTLPKIKYWLLMSIPLIYYLTQFQPYLFSIFSNYFLVDTVEFVVIYTIIFTAIEPIGGFLFGLAFWATSRKIESAKIKDYLFISGSGFMLFFVSNHAAVLVSYPFPPFGLIQICYLGLSSYLILTGIHSSAISVAQDDKLRHAIRESIDHQRSRFMEHIGTSEMSEIIYNRTFDLSKKLSMSMTKETNVSPSLTAEQVKDYIDEVMKERSMIDR